MGIHLDLEKVYLDNYRKTVFLNELLKGREEKIQCYY
jgi:hypothetical protein